jgi:hypothetical protein
MMWGGGPLHPPPRSETPTRLLIWSLQMHTTMTTTRRQPAPIMLSLEAVREGRASWRWRRPIDACIAVALGDALWLSDRATYDLRGLEFPRDDDDAPACCDARSPEPCLPCREHPAEMADTFRAEHAAALGAVLARPAADVFPEDVAWEPSEDDLSCYREWCREREERLWRERVDGPGVVEKLRAVANIYLDDRDDCLKGLGEAIWAMAQEAETLEARTWATYRDRLDCMQDARGLP